MTKMGMIYLSKKEKQKLLDIISNHLAQGMDLDEEESEAHEPERDLVLKIRDKIRHLNTKAQAGLK